MAVSPYLRIYGRHPLHVPLAGTRRLHGYNIETPLGDDKMERRNTRPDKSEVESKNAVELRTRIWKVDFYTQSAPRSRTLRDNALADN